MKKTLSAIFIAGCCLLVYSCKQQQINHSEPSTQGPKPTSQQSPVDARLLRIVRCYRQIILLLSDEDTQSAADRKKSNLLGQFLYQTQHQELRALEDGLQTELERARDDLSETPLRGVIEFTSFVKTSTDLREADRLAFLDALDELVLMLDERKAVLAGRVTAPRAGLVELRTELLDIQREYQNELAKVFRRFETRGLPPKREKWDEYVAFLRTQFSRQQIFDEHQLLLKEIEETPALETGITDRGIPAKTFVLSFDDGPHPRYTDKILAILNKYNIPATFFVLGQNLGAVRPGGQIKEARTAEVARKIVANGLPIANHSYSHRHLSRLSDKEIAEEIENTNALIEKTVRVKPFLFRPPYGSENQRVLAAVFARGMKSILWNIDSRDWADPIPLSIAHRAIREAHQRGRGILLFHDIHARTIEALPSVIEALQADGYRFYSFRGREIAEDRQRRGQPEVAASKAEPPILYNESWAVLVGIDEYKHWPRLQYAVSDARAIQDVLERKFNFKRDHIVTLLNDEATRARILSVFGQQLAAPEHVKHEDRVLVFFAGHGATRQFASGREIGYLVPVEADRDDLEAQAISMTTLQDISESLPAKHMFFIMDACYSGLALTRGVSQQYLQEVTRRIARQILTAGGAEEQVADTGPNHHSIFTWTLLQGLEGAADLDHNGYITATELNDYVSPRVSALSRQTPAFGNLVGSEGGNFLFELPRETEDLSQLSAQLDMEAIRLNEELERLSQEIQSKAARNQRMRDLLNRKHARLGAPGGETISADAGALGDSLRAARFHANRGHALYRERKYEQSLGEYQEAARLAPSDASYANNLGFVYYRAARYAEALQWLQKSVLLDPRRAVAWLNMGDTLWKLDRKSEAKDSYEKFLQMNPTTTRADEIRSLLATIN